MNSKSKYGDDNLSESFADNYLFFPIGDIFLPLLHRLKITPNLITLVSTICTTASIYYLNMDNFKYFLILYILGYFFDCMDGRMARKYKQGSTLGMVLDSSSDIVTNYLLLVTYIFKFYNKKNFKYFFTILVLVSYKISVNYGINEAMECYKKNQHDNFYQYKKEILKGFGTSTFKLIIKNIYLAIHKTSYLSYRKTFSKYDHKTIVEELRKTKEIGFGNYSIFIVVLIYYTMKYN